MVAKIEAAVAARSDNRFVVIARTDARAPLGLDEALRRAHAYRDAGADILFVEAPESLDEVERIASELSGTPLLFNWAEGGKTPPISLERLRALDFAIVIFPIATLLAATAAMRNVLGELRRSGTPLGVMDELVPFGEFVDFIGMPEIRELERRFGGRGGTP